MSLRILFCIALICSHLFCANAIQADDTIVITPAVNENTKDETQGKQQPKQQRNYPPQMDGAIEEIYKTAGDFKLKLYMFFPKDHSRNESRPAAIFFFGGGWRTGTPQQFEHHCRYLASRGMVAMTADYRVSSRNGTKAKECVADGKSAIRWVRQNAVRLGINPERILAGGGSAGGHVAACTGAIDGFDETSEDLTVSSRPNGLALFNPAVVLASVPGERELSEERIAELTDRMGVAPEKLSPFHRLEASLPPMIVLHGKADETVPFRTAELFVNRATELGGYALLKGYEEQGHGFFNQGRGDDEMYKATLDALDKFLVDTAFLQGR